MDKMQKSREHVVAENNVAKNMRRIFEKNTVRRSETWKKTQAQKWAEQKTGKDERTNEKASRKCCIGEGVGLTVKLADGSRNSHGTPRTSTSRK